MKAALIAGAAWFVVGVTAVRSKRTYAPWQIVVLKTVTFTVAILALAATVGFGITTMANPHNDLSRAYSFVFTLAFLVATVAFLILGAVMSERLHTHQAHPVGDSSNGHFSTRSE
jgi:chromate transport protein ChrA